MVETTISEEVATRLGGETINHCYQCGTCASSCPVTRLSKDFNPREIINQTLSGERDILLNEALWLCCSCYNCQERCPQKVEIADVIFTLRNIAIDQGTMPPIYTEFANALTGEGRIVKVSKFMEQKRSSQGLPPLQPTGLDALKKILAATKFHEQKEKKEES
jgi:heterodisulfide reductase subunit C